MHTVLKLKNINSYTDFTCTKIKHTREKNFISLNAYSLKVVQSILFQISSDTHLTIAIFSLSITVETDFLILTFSQNQEIFISHDLELLQYCSSRSHLPFNHELYHLPQSPGLLRSSHSLCDSPYS